MNKNDTYQLNLLKDTISNLNKLSQLVYCLEFAIKKEYMEYSAGAVLSNGNEYSLLLDVYHKLKKYISNHPTNIINPHIDINEIESTYDKTQEIISSLDNLLDNFVTNNLTLDLNNLQYAHNSLMERYAKFVNPLVKTIFPGYKGYTVFGYKGSNQSNAGYVHAPYVPLFVNVNNGDYYVPPTNFFLMEIIRKLISIL